MRKPQNLMNTEDLFLYLRSRGLAEPTRLSASVSRIKKGARYPGDPGRLEASLYLVYESPIFPRSPVGTAEVMCVQFPDAPETKLTKLLEDALWAARVEHGGDEESARLSAAVMERAEVIAFQRLVELPLDCLRQHDGVLQAARESGLISFNVPEMSPKENATLPANLTGLSRQTVDRLASEAPAPECDLHWSQDAAPGMG